MLQVVYRVTYSILLYHLFAYLLALDVFPDIFSYSGFISEKLGRARGMKKFLAKQRIPSGRQYKADAIYDHLFFKLSKM